MAATPEIALVAALLADAGVSAITTRVYPQEATQEPELPCIVYQRQGGEGRTRLAGGSRLRKYSLRVEAYAESESAAGLLARAIDAALDGYRNDVDGVQAVFLDDTDAGTVDPKPWRVYSRTVTMWHTPT